MIEHPSFISTVMCAACLDDAGWRRIFSSSTAGINLPQCQGLYTGGCTQRAIHLCRHLVVEPVMYTMVSDDAFVWCFLDDSADHMLRLTGPWRGHIVIFTLQRMA